MNILKPYEEFLKDSILEGWEDYTSSFYEDTRHIYDKRTRANIVNCHILKNARKKFEDVEKIHFIDYNGMTIINIEGKLALRFKKLDESKISHCVQTQQTVNYFGQKKLNCQVCRLISQKL